MRWAAAAVLVAIAAAIAVNVLLLGYGGLNPRNDPVGQLSPVASLPRPAAAPQPAPVTTTTSRDHHGSHDGQGADD